MKRDSEILHEIVRDTTQVLACFSDFLVVSRTLACNTSESPLHVISIFSVQEKGGGGRGEVSVKIPCNKCSNKGGNYGVKMITVMTPPLPRAQ